ncbi:MAG: TonB-dependent receptor, partial [Chamaesiphon sp. CSU_1_12]|nr:TonB-dependent receptor [Chamaesiphon sp. CSU_1_12]
MNIKNTIWIINAIACLTIASPAWAQLIPTVGKLKSTQPLAESVISQTPTGASVKITNVSIVSTSTGINVLLAPEAGTLPPAVTSQSGNTLITDLPNTTLSLADGKEFRSVNPFKGIASIVVTQFTPTSVRVSIIGTDSIPDVAVVPSSTGLTLSATPVEATDIEITVTAQKRRERLKDVPISVKVLPRQQIEDARIQTFKEVANNTPNFTFRPAGGGRQFAFYSFRGLSNSNFLSRKDTLGFYVDDVPYEYGGFIDLDLLDLDRIEVLRGPQSTLYGRNSQAGVINITTRQPSNDPELRGSASYGSYNDRNLTVSASTPLIKDNLLVSVGGGYRANDGFYRNTTLNQSEGQQSSLAGRLQFLWKPQPDLTVALNTNVANQDDGDVIYTPRTNPFQTQTNESGFVRNKTNTQALKVAYDNPDYRLTSVTTRRFSDQDGRNVLGVFGLDFLSNYGFNDTVWSQEFRVQSPPNNKSQLAWTAGLYAESSDGTAREASVYSPALATAFGLPSPGADLVSGNLGSKTYAAFGQVDYKPIEPLTVTAGLRYETNDLRLSSRQRSFTPTGSTTPVSVSGVFDNATSKDSELLPRVALQYRFSPEVSAYTSITRGYKPGAYNYRADTVGIQRIQPERSWNYEVGVKTAFLNNKVTVNLSAFSHSIDNYQ